MKKTEVYKKTISLLILVSVFSQSYAITSKEKGRILESFKKVEQDIIFEGEDYFESEDSAIFSSSKKLSVFNSITEKLKDKRVFLEKQNQNIGRRIASLEDNILDIENDITEISKQVSKTNDDIVYTNDQIEINQKSIGMLSKKIEENRAILLEYMVHLYKKGNYMYDEKDIDNIKTIILSGDDIGDVLSDVYFKGMIELSGQKLIEQHRAFVSQLYVKKINLLSEQDSLRDLRKSLIIEKKLLDDKKEMKKKLLEVSKGTQSMYKKYIAQKLDMERNLGIKALEERIKFKNAQKKVLEDNGCKYIDLSENTIFTRMLKGKCLELNKMIYNESLLRDNTPEDGTENVFDWPVFPYFGISAYFNDDEYRKEFGTNHGAVDIVAPQGTSIKAPADGYVTYVSPPNSDDYAFVALKHANGYVSVYGHISEVMVQDLEFVRKGQVFAKTGGEYGTKGAGILTTGPHLHFEVFKDKQSVDPLEYVNISVIPLSLLPDKYRYKFVADFKAKKGYAYEQSIDGSGRRVFKIEGSTEVERQKSLLSKYAAPAFKDWDIWIEESIDGKIDPTFVMCIGLAETSLGNRLKTNYNVGNVGNTDSGATWDFPNARTGIMWIVKTLNNKALGDYNEIQLLSRYGNKNGSIYASSPDHWHNNVTKCMSHIKQRYIPDDYNFRL